MTTQTSTTDKLVFGSIAIACIAVFAATAPAKHAREMAEMKRIIATTQAYLRAHASSGYRFLPDGTEVHCDSGIVVSWNGGISDAEADASIKAACGNDVAAVQ